MSSEVEVKVVYFASARECVGKESEVLRIEGTREDGQGEASTTTLALEKVLLETYPKLRGIYKTIALAVNMDYVARGEDHRLRAGDEVALIPPIGGG